MSQSFSCANCGATLDYDGTQLSVRCAYCGSSIVVPEALRPKRVEADSLVPDPTLSEVAILFRAGKRLDVTVKPFK